MQTINGKLVHLNVVNDTQEHVFQFSTKKLADEYIKSLPKDGDVFEVNGPTKGKLTKFWYVQTFATYDMPF